MAEVCETCKAPVVFALTPIYGVAVLALTLKIPGLMRNHVDNGLGFVRYVAYRQGAKSLENGMGSTKGGR